MQNLPLLRAPNYISLFHLAEVFDSAGETSASKS
jgi:hypothetical protein